MNKSLFLATGLTAVLSLTACNDEEPISKSSTLIAQLPEKAQQFVRNTFSGGTIVDVDRNLDTQHRQRGSSYEATLRVDNIKIDIEFDTQGNWTNIEAEDNQTIPIPIFSLIRDFPKNILTYVEQHHKGLGINEVEQKAYGIEVELVNGQKLLFDKSGDILKGQTAGDEPTPPPTAPQSVEAFIAQYFKGYAIAYQKKDIEDGQMITKYYIQKAGSYNEGYKLVYNAGGQLIEVEGDDDPMLPVSLDIVRLFSEQAAKEISAKYADYYVTEIELENQVVKVELQHRKQDRDFTLSFPINGGGSGGDHGGVTPPNPGQDVAVDVQNYINTHFAQFQVAKKYTETEDGMPVTKYLLRNAQGKEYKLVYSAAGQLIEVEGDDNPLTEIPVSVLNTFSPNIAPQIAAAYANYAVVEVKRISTGFQVELQHRTQDLDKTVRLTANGTIADGGNGGVNPPTPGKDLPANVQSFIQAHFAQFQYISRTTEKEDNVSVTKYLFRNAKGLEYKLVYNTQGQLIEVEGDDEPLAEIPASVLAVFSPNLSKSVTTAYPGYAVIEVQRIANGFKLELKHRSQDKDMEVYFNTNGQPLPR